MFDSVPSWTDRADHPFHRISKEEWDERQVTIETPEEPDTVQPGMECPDCGQSHTDWLVWSEDGEFVTCTTCGCVYVP